MRPAPSAGAAQRVGVFAGGVRVVAELAGRLRQDARPVAASQLDRRAAGPGGLVEHPVHLLVVAGDHVPARRARHVVAGGNLAVEFVRPPLPVDQPLELCPIAFVRLGAVEVVGVQEFGPLVAPDAREPGERRADVAHRPVAVAQPGRDPARVAGPPEGVGHERRPPPVGPGLVGVDRQRRAGPEEWRLAQEAVEVVGPRADVGVVGVEAVSRRLGDAEGFGGVGIAPAEELVQAEAADLGAAGEIGEVVVHRRLAGSAGVVSQPEKLAIESVVVVPVGRDDAVFLHVAGGRRGGGEHQQEGIDHGHPADDQQGVHGADERHDAQTASAHRCDDAHGASSIQARHLPGDCRDPGQETLLTASSVPPRGSGCPRRRPIPRVDRG
ncbi:MAG: hypothetical protein BIFFINMI_04409 [Phycisphaerae bacterium]|nr:hypothetical protein [Phycisphaerae bacterium]